MTTSNQAVQFFTTVLQPELHITTEGIKAPNDVLFWPCHSQAIGREAQITQADNWKPVLVNDTADAITM